MREVSIYIQSGIKSFRRQDGYIAYCLEYYPEGKIHPQTLIDVERVEDMTGKRAELESLVRAMRRMKEKCILSIYTDSQYINMGLGEQRQVDVWVKNGWKSGKNVAVKNEDKWKELLSLLNGTIYNIYYKQPNAYENLLQEELKKKG